MRKCFMSVARFLSRGRKGKMYRKLASKLAFKPYSNISKDCSKIVGLYFLNTDVTKFKYNFNFWY
jgi:hypothetical protein